jgi:Flp pilus assembly pilin Flp
MTLLRRMWVEDEAQDVAEYGLIAGLIAVTLVTVVTTYGNQVGTAWQALQLKITAAV